MLRRAWWWRTARARRWLCAALDATAGCDAAPRTIPAAEADPTVVVSAPRRPDIAYYLLNAGGKCFIYTEQDETRATRREELCPRDLEDGERIRLVGRTCMREGGGVGRDRPVRCPKALVFAESSDLADAGARLDAASPTEGPSAGPSAGSSARPRATP